MAKFKITVQFVVQAEDTKHWSADACALDYVRHRIDEGYDLSEHILEWDFVSMTNENGEVIGV